MSNLEEIRKDYEELVNLPPDADGAAKRARGYALERLLNKLFTRDELEPRAGYKPAGEQIDGSIYLDGRIYLLEAKWHADPLPASTLYQFKGKIDGKLAGNLGIFISMSGYAEDAVDAPSLRGAYMPCPAVSPEPRHDLQARRRPPHRPPPQGAIGMAGSAAGG